jgi:hypothetical protein
MQGGLSYPDDVVERLWRDVTDDIHRQDAELSADAHLTKLQAPIVEAAGWSTRVWLPIRRGVDLLRLERAVQALAREEARGPRRGGRDSFSLSSSRVSSVRCALPYTRMLCATHSAPASATTARSHVRSQHRRI